VGAPEIEQVVKQDQLGYLAIGHVTRDLLSEGEFTAGGTVNYAARTARALGCRVGVITSAGEDFCPQDFLPDVQVHFIPASATTTFENRYHQERRVQMVRAVATPLTSTSVPLHWRSAGVVHLGPVAQECDPAIIEAFPDSFVGITPQGWMRRWDEDGRVTATIWENADAYLPHVDAVVLSEEDVGGDERLVEQWASLARVLVVTHGAAGCDVYTKGRAEHVPGFPTVEVDPTGAGDVFAAVFFVRLQEGDSVREAARLANCVAAASVKRIGLAGAPTVEEIADCRSQCA
jgi:sugar/nucleoside kinase (ribokinase family)